MSGTSSTVELHLLRHADAVDPAAWAGDDASRPLTATGEGQAERLGRHLASIALRPDAILASPRRRAIETARIVAEALGGEAQVHDRLGGGLSLTTLAAILADAGDPRRPILVGHDPDFSELLAELCGAGRLPLRKAALARVDLASGLRPAGGVLRWLLPPDLLSTRR